MLRGVSNEERRGERAEVPSCHSPTHLVASHLAQEHSPKAGGSAHAAFGPAASLLAPLHASSGGLWKLCCPTLSDGDFWGLVLGDLQFYFLLPLASSKVTNSMEQQLMWWDTAIAWYGGGGNSLPLKREKLSECPRKPHQTLILVWDRFCPWLGSDSVILMWKLLWMVKAPVLMPAHS